MKKFKNHNIRKENKMHWYEKLNQFFYGESFQPVDEVVNVEAGGGVVVATDPGVVGGVVRPVKFGVNDL